MDVSKNNGTPKWIVYNGKLENPMNKWDDLGGVKTTPIFGSTPISLFFWWKLQPITFKGLKTNDVLLTRPPPIFFFCDLDTGDIYRLYVQKISRNGKPKPSCFFFWGGVRTDILWGVRLFIFFGGWFLRSLWGAHCGSMRLVHSGNLT